MENNSQQQTIITDQHWESRPPNGTWAAAKELHEHGAGPWKNVLNPKEALTPDGPTPPVSAALVKNDFLMRSLGRPHRDQVVTTRPDELTTLQAIDLANGEILAQYLQQGAKQLVQKPDLGSWLYLHALTRMPNPAEQVIINDVLGEKPDQVATEDLLWLMLMQPEFQMIR